MKIEIKRFVLTSHTKPLTPVVFNLDDYFEINRRKLESVFSKTLLDGESLDVTDMDTLLDIGESTLTDQEKEVIDRLKGLFYTLVAVSKNYCSVTCEWEDLG